MLNKEVIKIREEILKSVKNVCNLNDSVYDEFIEYYYNIGESQIKGYIDSKKLTSTLYILVHKFIIFKVNEGIQRNTNVILVEDSEVGCFDLKQLYKLDNFFLDYIKILNHYKRLKKIDI